MFGRSRKEDTVQEEVEEEVRPQLYDESELWQIPGPREEYEVDTSVDYVDLGSLRIPAVPGMQIRAQAGEDGQSIIRIMLVLASSGLQFSIAAAPRSGGTWDELRPQIRAAYEEGGSAVREKHTRYGDELEVDEAVTLPDGKKGTTRTRIIGREGDRWFARIDMVGPAALGGQEADDFEELIDRVVVVRGDEPRPRLDLLPLHLPDQNATRVPNV